MKESIYWRLLESSWKEHTPTQRKKTISKSAYNTFLYFRASVLMKCYCILLKKHPPWASYPKVGAVDLAEIARNPYHNDKVERTQPLMILCLAEEPYKALTFPLKALTCCPAHCHKDLSYNESGQWIMEQECNNKGRNVACYQSHTFKLGLGQHSRGDCKL